MHKLITIIEMILIMAKSIIFLIAFIILGYLRRAIFIKNIMIHTNNPYKGYKNTNITKSDLWSVIRLEI